MTEIHTAEVQSAAGDMRTVLTGQTKSNLFLSQEAGRLRLIVGCLGQAGGGSLRWHKTLVLLASAALLCQFVFCDDLLCQRVAPCSLPDTEHCLHIGSIM